LALSLYLRVESLIDKEQVYWGKKTKLGVMIIVDRIKYYFENNAFGVCSALGDKLGVATSSIRLFCVLFNAWFAHYNLFVACIYHEYESPFAEAKHHLGFLMPEFLKLFRSQ
jgi:phage shock protein PspC (stress-responsive transcriptional regulator)